MTWGSPCVILNDVVRVERPGAPGHDVFLGIRVRPVRYHLSAVWWHWECPGMQEVIGMVDVLRLETGEDDARGSGTPFESLSEEYQATVVEWSLSNRPRVSHAARNALDNTITGRVSMDGFREASAARAPVRLLIQPVRRAALAYEPLAEAVLAVWKESRPDLRAVVEAALRQQGLEVDANAKEKTADDDGLPLEDICAPIVAANPQYSSDDVVLMFMLTRLEDSQAVGDAQTEEVAHSPQFQRQFDAFLASLRALPAGYPEWREPLTQFIHDVVELRASKEREHEQASGVSGRINEVLNAHGDLLAFFEWDADERLPDRAGPWADAELALKAVDNLAELLKRYEALRATGGTYREEAARAADRGVLQEQIIAALTALEEALAQVHVEPAIEEIISQDSDTPEEGSSGTHVKEADDAERDTLQEMVADLQQENANLKATAETVQSEYNELKQQHRELRYEMEATRLSYADAHKVEEETPAPPPDFDTVAAVLRFVENRWPDRLLIALNNSSDRKIYFDQRSQVYSALEWLATTYRDSKMGDTPVGNLDGSLFETCGWHYRPFQSEVTVGKYRSDYEVIHDGKKYPLTEHIGRGAGNSAGQIRIAFAWDETRKAVVVGYIGRHQRTDFS